MQRGRPQPQVSVAGQGPFWPKLKTVSGPFGDYNDIVCVCASRSWAKVNVWIDAESYYHRCSERNWGGCHRSYSRFAAANFASVTVRPCWLCLDWLMLAILVRSREYVPTPGNPLGSKSLITVCLIPWAGTHSVTHHAKTRKPVVSTHTHTHTRTHTHTERES